MLNKLPIQTQQKLIEAIQTQVHEECTNIDSINLFDHLEELLESPEAQRLLEILMNINDLDIWIEEIIREVNFDIDPLLE